MKNAFIINETPPKPWHDLIISHPVQNNLPKTFLPKNNFLGKNPPRTLEESTMHADYFEMIVHNYKKISTLITNIFFNVGISNSTIPLFFVMDLRLHIIRGVIKIIFK